MIKAFGKVVLEDKKIEEFCLLKKARILMNLGMKNEGETLKTSWDADHYKFSDEEKKNNLEKIKGLRDP
jgi:hypothetical protein